MERGILKPELRGFLCMASTELDVGVEASEQLRCFSSLRWGDNRVHKLHETVGGDCSVEIEHGEDISLILVEHIESDIHGGGPISVRYAFVGAHFVGYQDADNKDCL